MGCGASQVVGEPRPAIAGGSSPLSARGKRFPNQFQNQTPTATAGGKSNQWAAMEKSSPTSPRHGGGVTDAESSLSSESTEAKYSRNPSWYPSEFGRVVPSKMLTAATPRGGVPASYLTRGSNHRGRADSQGVERGLSDGCSGESSSSDENEGRHGAGFYYRFLQQHGGTVPENQRVYSAKQLLALQSKQQHQLPPISTMIAGAPLNQKSTGIPPDPVNPDEYVQALHEYAREREKTRIRIDCDGEIRRLYHTEGWHQLRSSKKSRGHRRRSTSSASSLSTTPDDSSLENTTTSGHLRRRSSHHRSRDGERGSGGDAATNSSSQNLRQLSTEEMPRRPTGCATTLRNTKFGSAGMIFHAKPSAEFSDFLNSGNDARRRSDGGHGRGGLAAAPDGYAPAVPASNGQADFFSRAFGSGSASGTGAPPAATIQKESADVAPSILVRPSSSGVARWGSISSMKYEVKDGILSPPDASTPSNRTANRPNRRVSFSNDTRDFRNNPNYCTIPPDPEPAYSPLPNVNARDTTKGIQSGSFVQLTLLKDKMMVMQESK